MFLWLQPSNGALPAIPVIQSIYQISCQNYLPNCATPLLKKSLVSLARTKQNLAWLAWNAVSSKSPIYIYKINYIL